MYKPHEDDTETRVALFVALTVLIGFLFVIISFPLVMSL